MARKGRKYTYTYKGVNHNSLEELFDAIYEDEIKNKVKDADFKGVKFDAWVHDKIVQPDIQKYKNNYPTKIKEIKNHVFMDRYDEFTPGIKERLEENIRKDIKEAGSRNQFNEIFNTYKKTDFIEGESSLRKELDKSRWKIEDIDLYDPRKKTYLTGKRYEELTEGLTSAEKIAYDRGLKPVTEKQIGGILDDFKISKEELGL